MISTPLRGSHRFAFFIRLLGPYVAGRPSCKHEETTGRHVATGQACIVPGRMSSLSGGRRRRRRTRSPAQLLWLAAAFLTGFIAVMAIYFRL
jgi:hypothetical protein